MCQALDRALFSVSIVLISSIFLVAVLARVMTSFVGEASPLLSSVPGGPSCESEAQAMVYQSW